MLATITYAAEAATWQNFFLLVGTAAATLVGLMFVAVTFGAGLVTEESAPTARSFLDPVFAHFVQILLTASLIVMPSMTGRVLAVLLAVIASSRLLSLVRIFRHMLEAHRRHGDLDLSDWTTGVVVPLLVYLLLIATGIGFWLEQHWAFNSLAIVTVALLMLGVLGAWELMVWMALQRSLRKPDSK
jgi:hypothetical protein